MKTGMFIFGGIPHEKLAVLYKENGIENTFISSEEPDFDKVMDIYIRNGITVETLHAPFDGINAMWGSDKEKGDRMLARLFDSVDKCAKYGIPATIIHVSSGRPMPEITEDGIKRYTELFAYAKEKGVKVALENLRYTENLKYFLDRYEEPGFCWDTGHENCYTDGVNHMELFGKRLIALHIHDNRGEKDCDDHLLPFDGKIDFEKAAKYIAESGYKGTVMLEICRNSNTEGLNFYSNITDEEYVKKAAEAAQKIASTIQKYSK